MLWSKAFNPETDIPSLDGKVIIVTGGNTGLGKQAITQLAAHNPAHIYLAARTASKAASAIAEIKAAVPSTTAEITHLPLDLSSFASIRAAATTFTAASPRLDILMNNAGIMATPAGLTADGYEIQFGTNHVGHALLTKLLLPTLLATAASPASADVRIINLTSAGHQLAPRNGGIVFTGATPADGGPTPLKTEMSTYGTWTRYGQSKLANVLYARALAARHPALTSVSVHPGVILTDLYVSAAASNPVVRYGTALFGSLVMGSVAAGAKNQLWAATAPVAELHNGAYYVPVGKKSGGSAYAQDEALAERLWEWTEKELEGEKL